MLVVEERNVKDESLVLYNGKNNKEKDRNKDRETA
jgi:hypothetical protein